LLVHGPDGSVKRNPSRYRNSCSAVELVDQAAHPVDGGAFVFVAVRHTWGEDWVLFRDEDGAQMFLPRAWTDAADPDGFVGLAAGRCPFRLEDLVVGMAPEHLRKGSPR
jgi:hypothetical protein